MVDSNKKMDITKHIVKIHTIPMLAKQKNIVMANPIPSSSKVWISVVGSSFNVMKKLQFKANCLMVFLDYFSPYVLDFILFISK